MRYLKVIIVLICACLSIKATQAQVTCPAITVTTSSTPESGIFCYDGTLTVNVSGVNNDPDWPEFSVYVTSSFPFFPGTSGFAWLGGESYQIVGLPKLDYTLIVRPNYGGGNCPDFLTPVSVGGPNCTISGSVSTTSASGFGCSDGSITLTGITNSCRGYHVRVLDANNQYVTGAGEVESGATVNLGGLKAGNYTASFRNSAYEWSSANYPPGYSCETSIPFTISQPPCQSPFTITTSAPTAIGCKGDINLSLNVACEKWDVEVYDDQQQLYYSFPASIYGGYNIGHLAMSQGTYYVKSSNTIFSCVTWDTIVVPPAPCNTTFANLIVTPPTGANCNDGTISFDASVNDCSGFFTATLLKASDNSVVTSVLGPNGSSNGFGNLTAGNYKIRITGYTPGNNCEYNSGIIQVICPYACTGTVPSIPGVIAVSGGNAKVCPGDTRTYTTATASNVGWFWTVPTGAVINSGQGTNSISVTYDAGFVANGNLSVVKTNSCGNSTPRSLIVYRNPPLTPGAIVVTGGDAKVCSGDTRTYTTTAASDGTFNWTVPTGASINSGQGTNIISVTYDAGFVANGTISVVKANGCGNSTPRSLTVYRNAPLTPGAIVVTGGDVKVCPGDTRTYTTTAASDITFNWTVPTGATINSGQGTNSISVTYDAGFIANGTIAVLKTNGCGNSVPRSLSVYRNAPLTPGAIVVTGGDIKVCPGDTRTYTTTAASDVTFNWTVPPGAIINSGQGTNSISVTYNAGFVANGTISVVKTNGCGNSPARSLAVSRNIPATPSLISGSIIACPNNTAPFSVTNVPGITYYWSSSVPSVSFPIGQGSNAVTASFDGTFTTGYVYVQATNGCASSGKRSIRLASTPATPSAITGDIYGLCGLTAVPYSVTNIAGVSYNWSVPNGASIASGQGTNAITVNFNSAVSGPVSVTANNTCGPSVARSKTVQVIPLTPGIISGMTAVCPNSTGNAYSIAAVNGASSYTWTGPTGSHISDGVSTSVTNVLTTTSTSVTMDFTVINSSSRIMVKANSTCGSSSTRTVYLTNGCSKVNVEPAEITKVPVEDGGIKVFPNPSKGVFLLEFVADHAQTSELVIVDAYSKTIKQEKLAVTAGKNEYSIDISKFTSGMYLVKMRLNGSWVYKKLIKQ